VTFVFEPARSLLIVSAVLVVAAILSLLLSRRNPARKAIGLVIVVALVGIMLLRYRTAELTVNDAGISADTYATPRIEWAQVNAARYIDDLSASRYAPRPNFRTSLRLIGYARARYGWFDTAGDEEALFAVQRVDNAAVVIATDDTTYVFSPSDPAGLAQAIAAHITVTNLNSAP